MRERETASFRDPAGEVYRQDGVVYRQINPPYMNTYRMLMDSGLYEALVKERLLIPHKEESEDVIHPKLIPFISYPYEWCFGQYKAAAITTLRVHLLAMQHGMVLKDASAYNIQFLNGYAVLIDTLSFEPHHEGLPWGAYGQFCRHFLAPLLLMARIDVRLNKLMASYIDGIPLDMADNILRSKGRFFGWQHIRLHSRAILRHSEAGKQENASFGHINKQTVVALATSLLRNIEKIKPKETVTEWGDYYKRTNYSKEATEKKGKIVSLLFEQISEYKNIWDLGANDGRYTRLAIAKGKHAVAFDIDPNAVERNFMEISKSHEAILPLLLDLTAPSPAIGFANAERTTIGTRQKPDVILMLAVIHHMAISNNLPFEMIAKWLAELCQHLIIEFVPKEDSQVQILLQTRIDIFPKYTQQCFEEAFSQYFTFITQKNIPDSVRVLYLLKKR